MIETVGAREAVATYAPDESGSSVARTPLKIFGGAGTVSNGQQHRDPYPCPTAAARVVALP